MRRGRGEGATREGDTCFPRRRRPTPTRELLTRWHLQHDRAAREELVERFLPLARQPRPPLPARRRAVRRPRPGRVARAAEGDRPLRPRPRGRLLELRGPDHPRRDQAPLPRPHLGCPRPARPAGARAEGRPGGRGAVARPAAAAVGAQIAEVVGATDEQVLEALEAAGAYRTHRRPAPGGDDERRRHWSATRRPRSGVRPRRGPGHARAPA